jgi:glucokinase
MRRHLHSSPQRPPSDRPALNEPFAMREGFRPEAGADALHRETGLASYPRLLGDIGGTHARLARVAGPGRPLQDHAIYRCADYPSLQAVMRRYIEEHALREPHWCAIGIANPVTGDRVRMTNLPWSFSVEQMQRELGFARLLVINDFSALALSLPVLDAGQLRQVGPGAAIPGTPRALLGPGTGLGVSGLLPGPHGEEVPISGEGGHVTLSAADEEEVAIIAALQHRFGHASAERALSGPGLVNLYQALCRLRGVHIDPGADAALITHAGLTGECAQCVSAIEMFCSMLGTVAGNLALTLGARGGVYIGGGIVPKLGAALERSRFRERFEAKGRFTDYLHAIPTFVIEASTSPALLGASRALDVA